MPLSYLDRSFCSSDCVNRACGRNRTPMHLRKAQQLGLAFSLTDFKTGCEIYISPRKAVRSPPLEALPVEATKPKRKRPSQIGAKAKVTREKNQQARQAKQERRVARKARKDV